MRASPGVTLAFACAAFATTASAAETCGLLKPVEMEGALGGKAGSFATVPGGPPWAANAHCKGEVGKYVVHIISTGSGHGDDRQSDGYRQAEKGALEAVRKLGVKVDVKTDGDLMCKTMIAPPAMAQFGVSTNCSIFRKGHVLTVEVTGPPGAELVGKDTVGKLVETAAGRL